MSQPIEELLQQCTVRLNLPGKYGHGTGFFVAPGLILTCAHVVKGLNEGEKITVRWQGQDDFAQADIEQTLPTFDLALLRFMPPEGTVLPCVYLDESVKTGDPLYLFGYPDQDFPNGCPVTFNCEGLTGDTPPLIKFKLGQVRPGMSGAPLLNRRTGKVCGIVKFTRDRSIDLGGGAVPTSVIVTELGKLKQLQRTFHKRDRRWQQLIAAYDQLNPRLVRIASAGAIFLVLLVRFLGVLQPLELWAYDLLMSRRPSEEVDKHVAVIGLTVNERTDEISDENLLELLTQLNKHTPQVIGLDIYRGHKNEEQAYEGLIEYLENTSNNVVSICQIAETIEESDAYPPSSDIAPTHLGFADSFRDRNGNVVRRHLLAVPTKAINARNTPCKTPISLSWQLALNYLKSKGIAQPQNKSFELGGIDVGKFLLGKRAGGYQRPWEKSTNSGWQILLNYRHPNNNRQSFDVIEMKYDEITQDTDLSKKYDLSIIQDRIVIVGYFVVKDGKNPDYVPTPLGYEDLSFKLSGESNDRRIPGSFVQAHKVSQLVNAVLPDENQKRRSLIWVWPGWIEIIWILSWGGIAGFTVWRFRGLHLVIASAGIIIIVTGFSYVVLSFSGGWLPHVPPILGVLLITSAINPGISLLQNYNPKLNATK